MSLVVTGILQMSVQLPPIPWLFLLGLLSAVCSLVAAVKLYQLIVLLSSHQKRVEVIVIEESPMPTRRPTTPLIARSVGGSRKRDQRRRNTAWYDPKMKDHCAYQALLKAAGWRPTKSRVKALRRRTASRVQDMLEANQKIGKYFARQYVQASGMEQHDYIRHIMKNQWASALEVQAAVDVLCIRILLNADGELAAMGKGRLKGMMVLSKGHYTLRRIRLASVTSAKASGAMRRGGMKPEKGQDWTAWQSEPGALLLDPDQARVVSAAASSHFQGNMMVRLHGTDVELSMRTTRDIEELKSKLNYVLNCEDHHLTIVHDGEELPDWVQPFPDLIVIREQPKKLKVKINEQQIEVEIKKNWEHADLVKFFAVMFSVIPRFVKFYIDGSEWMLTQPLPEEGVNLVFQCQRGGMQPRTVSTTLRWDEGSGSSSESPLPRYEARPRSSRSRSNSPRRRAARALEHAPPVFRSSAVPPAVPPAQHDMVGRMARDPVALVGEVRANPQALAEEVIREMANELALAQTPSVTPEDAVTWEQVEGVRMALPPPLRRPVVIDLRDDAWERYQWPRLMPLLEAGNVDHHIVIPAADTLREAQNRVNAWTEYPSIHIVMALDCEQWLVHRIQVPEAYRRMQHREEDFVDWSPRGPSRGGALQFPEWRSATYLPIREIQIEDDGQRGRVIFAMLAHDPNQVTALWVTREAKVWHLMDFLENKYGMKGKLRLSTLLFPLHIAASLYNIPGAVVV